MNRVDDSRKLSRAGLPKIVRRDLTSKDISVRSNDKPLSTFFKVLVGLICISILSYAGLVTSLANIPETSFGLSFISRDDPRDEFSIVRPSRFNREMIKIGETWAKQEGRLLVVSLVRDCEASIECMEQKVKVLASIFKTVHVVAFENDSVDKTRDTLLDFARGTKTFGGPNVRVSVVNPFTMEENEETCITGNDFFSQSIKKGIQGAGAKRILKMTFLRNKVLDYVYQHQSDYNTLLMTDLDIIGRIFPYGIKETVGYLRTMKDIGFVSFRGYYRGGGFFDPYSYRGKDVFSQTPITTLMLCMKGYYNMPSGRGLEPVCSAHSGGAFINLPLPPHLRYTGKRVLSVPLVSDLYLCEHITLQENVQNNFVNTNMSYLVKDHV
jgi:hypothetical protein